MVRSRRVALLAFGLAALSWSVSALRSNAQDNLPKPPDLPLTAPAAEAGPAPAQALRKVEAVPERAPVAEAAPLPSAPPPLKKSATVGRSSLLRLFVEGNPMLWPLLLCSVVAVGFALERLIALRRERVIPRDFVDRFLDRLSAGKLDRDRALELCKANDSPVARVFALIVNAWGQPGATIRQSLGYDAAGEVADLKRNVRVLNATATIAPLLGLLGTVFGMIQAFDAVGGRVGPAKGEALAHGISLALLATALGLAIAIVSVTAYYYLLNRVDILARALDDQARQVIDLVAFESIRPIADRRPSLAPPSSEIVRPESVRTH